MQIHGNVLTSDESGELAAIIDRDAISTGERNHEWFELNECNAERCPVCKADYASIADRSRLLALHYRLAARVAEQDRELTRIKSLIEAAGGEHGAGFDWSMLGRIDELETALTAAREELSGWKENCELFRQKFGNPNEMPENVARLMIAGDTVPRALVRIAEENASLRAELAQTPPTMEWLVSVLGPCDDRGGVAIWSKGLRLIYHYKADQRTEIQQDGVSEWELLRTRDEVLAAVAETKGEP